MSRSGFSGRSLVHSETRSNQTNRLTGAVHALASFERARIQERLARPQVQPDHDLDPQLEFATSRDQENRVEDKIRPENDSKWGGLQ